MTHYVGENDIHKATRHLHDQRGKRFWKKDRERNKLKRKLKRRSKRKLREQGR